MNTPNSKIEKCRQLMAELRWNERHVDQSIKIAVSKAVWLGLEVQDVFQLVRTIPSTSYLRQYPHILTQTWNAIAHADPNQHLTEFERLLNGLN